MTHWTIGIGLLPTGATVTPHDVPGGIELEVSGSTANNNISTKFEKAVCPPDRSRLRIADSGGLYLEVMPSGAKHWRWKYRIKGREKRLALGSFPETSLERARRDRDVARKALKAGIDPVIHKHAMRDRGSQRLKGALAVLLEELRAAGRESDAVEVENVVRDNW